MQISDLLAELQGYVSNLYANNLKNEDPKNLDQITKLFNNLTEVAIHVMRESPEFRSQFARIHAEFLKHPECREVIEGSINAVSQYKPDLLKN